MHEHIRPAFGTDCPTATRKDIKGSSAPLPDHLGLNPSELPGVRNAANRKQNKKERLSGNPYLLPELGPLSMERKA